VEASRRRLLFRFYRGDPLTSASDAVASRQSDVAAAWPPTRLHQAPEVPPETASLPKKRSFPSRVRLERRATFRMPSDETLRIALVSMLPLLHFSRFRVAVPSSSAPAFDTFASGPGCHLTDPQPVRFRRCLASRCPSRLWAILWYDRNPEVFRECSRIRTAFSVRSSIAILPSSIPISAFYRPTRVSSRGLDPHGSGLGYGPYRAIWSTTPASIRADAPSAFF